MIRSKEEHEAQIRITAFRCKVLEAWEKCDLSLEEFIEGMTAELPGKQVDLISSMEVPMRWGERTVRALVDARNVIEKI